MMCIRITISIDDDVLLAVEEKALRESRSVGAILSELARQALTNRDASLTGPADDALFGFEPLPHRGVTITNALIDRG